MSYTTGVADNSRTLAQLFDEIFDPHGFFLRIEAALQSAVVSGDTGWTGILVHLND